MIHISCTKERILQEALSLFSIKGYDGVSMSDIAEAVGIKAASIYKHYAGKEAIFHSIVQSFEERTEAIFHPELLTPALYQNITPKELIVMISQTFQQYATDPFLSNCRRLFLISSFGRPEIGDMYTNYFLTMPIQYQSTVFSIICKTDTVKEKDYTAMAYHFYAPILILLQQYDYKNITLEEALAQIKSLVNQFAEVYGL